MTERGARNDKRRGVRNDRGAFVMTEGGVYVDVLDGEDCALAVRCQVSGVRGGISTGSATADKGQIYIDVIGWGGRHLVVSLAMGLCLG